MRNQQATKLLTEMSKAGRRAATFPASDVPRQDVGIPSSLLAEQLPSLPELTEPDIIRHYTNLSTLNMSVDTHFYPLGSCTMKYNPKRHERLSSLPGIVDLHPYQDAAGLQGMLGMMHELQGMLAEIAGLPAISLQPAAGAQGEYTALLVASAYFKDKGEKRKEMEEETDGWPAEDHRIFMQICSKYKYRMEHDSMVETQKAIPHSNNYLRCRAE